MNFEEARLYLSSALAFGIQLGLQRMNRLMDLLDHPERQTQYIHIAGTNGKGSTAAYCASILAMSNRRVGVYTSPYLVRFTERIRILEGIAGLQELAEDETTGEIAPDEFAAIMTRVRTAVEAMLAEGSGQEHPTEFELITAAAFLYFAEKKCDLVVLETGLGGRLDSTNVIEKPLASIITALGYDHMDRLGSTLAEIAAEKAGIIKPGCPVFLYDPHDLNLSSEDAEAAFRVIQKKCAQDTIQAPLHVVHQAELVSGSYGLDGQTFIDTTSGLHLTTSLMSMIQPMNAALAVRACRALSLATDEQIQAGIAATRWPARMELLRTEPPVILDGSHNPQGCQALAASLNRLLPGKPAIFLAGILQDKDYTDMLRTMLKGVAYRPYAFICVTPDNPRALPAEALAEAVRRAADFEQLPSPDRSRYNSLDAVMTAASPADGARFALDLAIDSGIALCAFGSLYMVGGIRNILAAWRR